jgi:hypothetical protein
VPQKVIRLPSNFTLPPFLLAPAADLCTHIPWNVNRIRQALILTPEQVSGWLSLHGADSDPAHSEGQAQPAAFLIRKRH